MGVLSQDDKNLIAHLISAGGRIVDIKISAGNPSWNEGKSHYLYVQLLGGGYDDCRTLYRGSKEECESYWDNLVTAYNLARRKAT